MTTELKGTPNFTIILPGPCQASCEFCYWTEEAAHGKYLDKLKRAIRKLPAEYLRVSLTGGEPTISPFLEDVVKLLRAEREWEAIVLTTNAVCLDKYLDLDVDHFNISRHHHERQQNVKIFKTRKFPHDRDLKRVIEELNKRGKDVTFNAVLVGQFEDAEDLMGYIESAKEMGVSQVSLRSDQRNEQTEPPKEMTYLAEYRVIEKWSCDACMVWRQIVKGMPVFWKASVSEPSVKVGQVYELVFHPSGKLTIDWAGKKPFKPGNEFEDYWGDVAPQFNEPRVVQILPKKEAPRRAAAKSSPPDPWGFTGDDGSRGGDGPPVLHPGYNRRTGQIDPPPPGWNPRTQRVETPRARARQVEEDRCSYGFGGRCG